MVKAAVPLVAFTGVVPSSVPLAEKLTVPVGMPVVVETTEAVMTAVVNCGLLLLVTESSEVVFAAITVMVPVAQVLAA